MRKYVGGGAYASNINFQLWKKSGGKQIFTIEDHRKEKKRREREEEEEEEEQQQQDKKRPKNKK